MGRVHQLIEARGKAGAIGSGAANRDIIEAAARYMSDEDNALAFAYSGWAQCALPHRRIAAGEVWEVASDRMRLVVEPGRRPSGRDGSGPLELTSVPFGAYARLILLYLQTEALRTNSPEVLDSAAQACRPGPGSRRPRLPGRRIEALQRHIQPQPVGDRVRPTWMRTAGLIGGERENLIRRPQLLNTTSGDPTGPRSTPSPAPSPRIPIRASGAVPIGHSSGWGLW